MHPQPATVLGSATTMLTSANTGRDYRILVSLPLGYDKSPGEGWPFNRTPDQWPTVYVLDGNWYFGMVTDIVRPMAWCGSTTDAIIVGIGYPTSDDPIDAFRESFTRRNADLTPVRDTAEEAGMAAQHERPAPTGDAANFQRFIQYELIPFIEQTYRADPAKRTLLGHSYGGLFGLCALFEAPELFATWVLGSPTLAYGDRVTFAREEAYAKAHTQLATQVYLYAAEHEEAVDDTTLTDTLRMAAILQSRDYAGLQLVKQIFLDQNHCEVAALGFQAGLKLALAR